LGVSKNDEAKMLKAIEQQVRDHASKIDFSERNYSQRAQPHSSASETGKSDTVVWGYCYGELGPPGKGQKHGWFEMLQSGKKWVKVYGKRARNTLHIFVSEEKVDKPIQSVCLDGAIVSRNDDRRPHCVEICKNIFEASKQDFSFACKSAKEADSWEKALVKGVVWHGEQKAKAKLRSTEDRAPSMGPQAPLSAPLVTPASDFPLAMSGPQSSTEIGHTFFYKSKKSIQEASEAGAAGLGLNENRRSNSFGSEEPAPGSKDWTVVLQPQQSTQAGSNAESEDDHLTVRLDALFVKRPDGAGFNNPHLHISVVGTVGKKAVVHDVQDVLIHGDAGDSEDRMSIAATRSISVADDIRNAPDVSLYLEFRHQKPGKGSPSVRAWTYLPITGILPGELQLPMCVI